MKKTILLTGATDGIGLETAKLLAADGHHLLLHGRNPGKLESAKNSVAAISGAGDIDIYVADFSRLAEVESLARTIVENHHQLDVLINNAGVFKTPNPIAENGLDVRFVVNTLAPYQLTRRLLEKIPATGRVVNLSSAAQESVDLSALRGDTRPGDMPAYAQSKLAITMWSRHLAHELGSNGPVVVAVNPGSLLATKMVKEGFGMDGHDLSIGARILQRAALSDEFADASGKYFDNDAGRFADPHADALDDGKCAAVVQEIERILSVSNL